MVVGKRHMIVHLLYIIINPRSQPEKILLFLECFYVYQRYHTYFVSFSRSSSENVHLIKTPISFSCDMNRYHRIMLKAVPAPFYCRFLSVKLNYDYISTC